MGQPCCGENKETDINLQNIDRIDIQKKGRKKYQAGKSSSYADGPRVEKGPHTFESGAVYTGEWLGENRDGNGTQKWPDGAQYIGEWRNNKAEGKGVFTHVDGDVYDGE